MKKVLLIDDDKAVNYYNEHVIAKHTSFDHVLTFQSGKEGLAFLKKAQLDKSLVPDIIFLDINMPAMNGWEFLDHFEKMDIEFRKDIKVIILSSSSNPEHINKSMDSYDVVDFINKPLSFNVLEYVYEKHVLSLLSKDL